MPPPTPPPEPHEAPEFRCASCNCADLRVVSRKPNGPGRERVRRACRHCGRTLTVTEVKP